jgi:hypothetical protein
MNCDRRRAGFLSTGTAVSNCKAGLYLFAGASAIPDDGDGDTADDGGADPVAYQPVVYDGTNTTVSFTIPFVAVGSYTIAVKLDIRDISSD